MFETLKNIDRDLLLFGNSFHNGFLDKIIPHLTGIWVWLPLFIWWTYELYKIYGKKLAIIVLCVIGLLVAADRSSVLIKNTVKRYRPSHNLELKDKVYIVDNYRGGQYGYVSSHATNAFAITFFIFFLIRSTSKKWMKLSLALWALIFCFTRIYLGVHYPFDLLSGALLGSLLAFLFYKIFCKFST